MYSGGRKNLTAFFREFIMKVNQQKSINKSSGIWAVFQYKNGLCQKLSPLNNVMHHYRWFSGFNSP